MKVTGIIAEYNPFHNGHKYQIDQIKKDGSDYIIAVMSGNFSQRGEAAIVDKFARTRMALAEGVDLVIELPVCFAVNSAGTFAAGGVSILDNLGVVDNLAFGIEPHCEQSLLKLASFLASPPSLYESELDNNLRAGMSFPMARKNALAGFFTQEELAGIDKPNSILAVEYCRVIHKLGSHIQPVPIQRVGGAYNDKELDIDGMSSAGAIRLLLSDYYASNRDSKALSRTLALLRDHMPSECVDILENSEILFQNDFSEMLHYKLLTTNNFADYADITTSFGSRIEAAKSEFLDYDSFCGSLKSKNITYTSVNRLLTHILLDMKISYPQIPPYARVLGFREESSPLLSHIKKNSRIPLITKVADADPIPLLLQDIKATDIYNACITAKYGKFKRNDYTHGVIIV